MTGTEALLRLKDIIANSRGEDEDHSLADEILCDLLITIGYDVVVTEYNKIHKWFS